jgi:hypothetical protein
MSEANLKIYGATADGKMLVSAEEVQAIISKELAVAGEEIEQLQKENAELRKELVAAVELMEGFNKAVAEWNNHDQ